MECWGHGLNPEVKLLSLRLYRAADSFVLASLNVFADNCLTYTDYSSCVINTSDTHKSRVRVLVYDLEEGDSRRYGCKATVVESEGEAKNILWSTVVTRQSKYKHYKGRRICGGGFLLVYKNVCLLLLLSFCFYWLLFVARALFVNDITPGFHCSSPYYSSWCEPLQHRAMQGAVSSGTLKRGP